MFCITGITLIHFLAFCVYFGAAILLISDGLKDMTRLSVFIILVVVSMGSINKMLLQSPCISKDFAEMVYDLGNYFWRGNSLYALVVAVAFSGVARKRTIVAMLYAVTAFTAFAAYLGYHGHIDDLIRTDFGYIAIYAKGMWSGFFKTVDDICNVLMLLFLLYGTAAAKNKIKKMQGYIFLSGAALSVLLVYFTRYFSTGFLRNSADINMLPGLLSMAIAMKFFGFIEDTKAAAASYIFDSSLEMMAILDAEKKVAEANSALISVRPEYFANSERPYLGEVIGNEQSAYITGILDSEGSVKGREIVFESGNSTFHGLVSGYVMKRTGITSGYAIVITDITRIKEAEEELKAYRDHLEEMITDRTKELDAANASLKVRIKTSEDFIKASHHDLMEPIRAISKMLQLVMKKNKDINKETSLLISESVRYSEILETLIYDIREYTMLEGGDYAYTVFNLRDAMDEVFMENRALISGSGADILVDAGYDVRANKKQIKQLLTELIDNSIKFRAEEPVKVSIKAERANDHVLVTVTDNGIGIPDEYTERVFGAFERLHTRETYAGNGIGLAICAKIIELHGKRIWAEKGVKKGAIISFELEAEQ